MMCDPSESGCSTYSQNEINMDRHDLTIQSELENRIDKIERKIRKRSIDQSESSSSFDKKTSKKEISIHFTSEEISTDEMSGDYGDELSDDEDDLTMPEITGTDILTSVFLIDWLLWPTYWPFSTQYRPLWPGIARFWPNLMDTWSGCWKSELYFMMRLSFNYQLI